MIYVSIDFLDGVFGAMMVVDIANDGMESMKRKTSNYIPNSYKIFHNLPGPVTLQLDSRKFTYDSWKRERIRW